MLQLRAFADLTTLDALGAWLETSGHGRHAVLVPAQRDAHSGLLTADVASDSAQEVLAHLHEVGLRPADIELLRVENIDPAPPGSRAVSMIWPDMLGMARRNARPLGRYVAFMAVAGVIAGYGVITTNPTLIVGAMAVSPDTLPVVSACVGIVGGRWRLAAHAVGTLVLGLAVTALAAAAVAGIVDQTNRLPAGLTTEAPGLEGLITIGVGTVGVALAAGVAAMLAQETRASSAVGVAISITTIPAAAYIGVALVVRQLSDTSGALAVLGVNVAMLLVGGTVTLALQRWFYRQSASGAVVRGSA